MKLLDAVYKFSTEILLHGRFDFSLVGNDHLYSPGTQIFPGLSAHPMAYDYGTVAQPVGHRLMSVRIAVAVMMFVMLMRLVLFLKMSRE